MPTLFKRSNGIYYAIPPDASGRRKWVSTGERRRNLALKKISILQPELSQQTKSSRLSEFYREFVEFTGTVYSKETVGIYKRSFNNLITICRRHSTPRHYPKAGRSLQKPEAH
ncbi:MAG: hypothetical protein HW412_1462 [Bacteroidetes bacterium]|nr:hypothetical protein [Bacteroidota bacterium]